jgi:hypothetical protein
MSVMALPTRTTAKRRRIVKRKLDWVAGKEGIAGGWKGVDLIGLMSGEDAGEFGGA